MTAKPGVCLAAIIGIGMAALSGCTGTPTVPTAIPDSPSSSVSTTSSQTPDISATTKQPTQNTGATTTTDTPTGGATTGAPTQGTQSAPATVSTPSGDVAQSFRVALTQKHYGSISDDTVTLPHRQAVGSEATVAAIKGTCDAAGKIVELTVEPAGYDRFGNPSVGTPGMYVSFIFSQSDGNLQTAAARWVAAGGTDTSVLSITTINLADASTLPANCATVLPSC